MPNSVIGRVFEEDCAVRKLGITMLAVMMAVMLAGCTARQEKLSGTYKAVDAPVATGETVTQELAFDGQNVTMISGSVQQTVKYTMKDGKFTIHTKFGEFSYDCQTKDNGDLVIDGVTYKK